jgi:multiple sugar transport system substrate-binding protein
MSKPISRRGFLKLAASLAGTVAVAGLGGCAGSTPAPAGVKEGETSAKPPAPEAVELRFIKLSMADPVTQYFTETAIPQFEDENPGAKVTVDMSDWDHLGEKLLTSFAGNIPIDLVETGSDWVGPYAKRNQFLPLDEFLGGYPELDDFYKEMVDISRYQGKLMALPYILDVRTICYRKDHLKEAGLDPERPPDTWEDLVNYATKLVQTDAQGNISRAGYMIDASGPAGAFFEFWYLLVENGSGVIMPWESWDPANVTFNGPEGVEALQFLYDLINKYKVSPISGMSAKTPNLSALAEGVTSLTVQGSWEIGNWKLYQPDKLDLLGIGVPLMKKKRLQYACPNVYAIGTNTKVPTKAFDLMKFMVSKETMTGMLGPDNNLPPRKSVAVEADYMKDPMLKKFQDVVENGWGTTTPQAVDFPTLEIIGNYVQAALRGEVGIAEALDTSAEEVKKKITESL